MGRGGLSLLLPVELRAVNRLREHQLGTILSGKLSATLQGRDTPTMGFSLSSFAMAHSDTIDQIAERVDHLLLRHEELQRTNALLAQQVQALTQERDQLKSRLAAARARIDALIERLPTSGASASSETSA